MDSGGRSPGPFSRRVHVLYSVLRTLGRNTTEQLPCTLQLQVVVGKHRLELVR